MRNREEEYFKSQRTLFFSSLRVKISQFLFIGVSLCAIWWLYNYSAPSFSLPSVDLKHFGCIYLMFNFISVLYKLRLFGVSDK